MERSFYFENQKPHMYIGLVFPARRLPKIAGMTNLGRERGTNSTNINNKVVTE